MLDKLKHNREIHRWIYKDKTNAQISFSKESKHTFLSNNTDFMVGI